MSASTAPATRRGYVAKRSRSPPGSSPWLTPWIPCSTPARPARRAGWLKAWTPCAKQPGHSLTRGWWRPPWRSQRHAGGSSWAINRHRRRAHRDTRSGVDARGNGGASGSHTARGGGLRCVSYYRYLPHLQAARRLLAHQEIAQPVGIVSLGQFFQIMRATTLLPGQGCQSNGLGYQHEIVEFQ